MRAVVVEVPPAWIEQRRRQGVDRWDELWEGVLHLVPPPSGEHQRLGTRLVALLAPVADARGLVPSYETGLWRTDDDYRVPDLLFCRPDQASARGAEGAEVIVELRSPGDETYEKLDFYAAVAVTEVFVVHPADRRVELFVRRGDRLLATVADPELGLRSEVLGLRLRTVEGPALELVSDDGAVHRV